MQGVPQTQDAYDLPIRIETSCPRHKDPQNDPLPWRVCGYYGRRLSRWIQLGIQRS